MKTAAIIIIILEVMISLGVMIMLVPGYVEGGKPERRSLSNVSFCRGPFDAKEQEWVPYNCTGMALTLAPRNLQWVREHLGYMYEDCASSMGTMKYHQCLEYFFHVKGGPLSPACRSCIYMSGTGDFIDCVAVCFDLQQCVPIRPASCGWPAICKTVEIGESPVPLAVQEVQNPRTDSVKQPHLFSLEMWMLRTDYTYLGIACLSGLLLCTLVIVRCCCAAAPTPLEVMAASVGLKVIQGDKLVVGVELEERFLEAQEETLHTIDTLLMSGVPMPPRPGRPVPRFVATPYARVVAAEARANLCFGFSTQINNATHRLAQQKCWQILQDAVLNNGLRKAHALAILPMATALTLVPSRRELEARALLATGTAAAVRRLSTAALYHEYGGEVHPGLGECSQDF
jgi:hypothetical protein